MNAGEETTANPSGLGVFGPPVAGAFAAGVGASGAFT